MMNTTNSAATGVRESRQVRQKRVLRGLLEARDHESLIQWADGRKKGLTALVSILLYETDELMRWRCVEGMGVIARDLAPRGLEQIRDIIRRLLWTMNDESGNVGWFAPEAIGEILANVPRLAREFAGLLPNFLVEEPFERGTHWAMVRVADLVGESPTVTKMLEDGEAVLVQSLEDEDAFTRAHAALALRRLGRLAGATAALENDRAPFTVYDFDSGRLTETSVSGLLQGTAD